MIKYYRLFDLLNRKGMKKTDLLEVISSSTLAKLGKGKNVETDAIDKICLHLHCQPGDIMEVIEQEITEPGSITLVKPRKAKEQAPEDHESAIDDYNIRTIITDKEKHKKHLQRQAKTDPENS